MTIHVVQREPLHQMQNPRMKKNAKQQFNALLQPSCPTEFLLDFPLPVGPFRLLVEAEADHAAGATSYVMFKLLEEMEEEGILFGGERDVF